MTEPAGGRGVILVADDDEDLRELTIFQLEMEGYDVVSTDDGADALRLARERHPDACVLDIHMPGLQGHEVLKNLRSSPDTSDIPVILVTATMDLRSLWRLGPKPDDCMRKTSISELTERLAAVLDRSPVVEAT